MGIFPRKKVTEPPIKPNDEQSSLEDEGEKRRAVLDNVDNQMYSLFAPGWTPQTTRMLEYIHKMMEANDWLWLEGCNKTSPVIAVRTGMDYRVYPVSKSTDLLRAAIVLKAEVAVIVSTPLIANFIRGLVPQAREARLGQLCVQVVQDLSRLKYVRRYQYAAFIRSTGQLLIWEDDYRNLLPYIMAIEENLVKTLWSLQESEDRTSRYSPINETVDFEDEEKRPVQLLLPCMVFGAIMVNFIIVSLAVRTIIYESLRSRTWYRLAIIPYFPIQFFLTSFFSLMLIVSILNFIGPVGQLFQNSRFYSCIPPSRITEDMPHITVQCPIYKEDLADVIVPTMESLKFAISTYEKQGGSASIFVNDDGMQLISEEQRELRLAYYKLNGIGWVARPAHGKKGFVRAGRFKKASNMNFAMDVSIRVEAKLEAIDRTVTWSDEDEELAFAAAVKEVIAEIKDKTGHEAWAAGDIRIGELILLIDSDTRVPVDCFLDAASEFHHSPQLAIIQHQSGVMQVVFDFWENAITYFTKCIYFSLQYATAAGDTAAFVGHNAFLRWSALQEVAWLDPTDDREKWWSESHVSEDFEMSLKLQTRGYISRYATYSNEQFEEGVSLTCYDELTRWSKYAYGCSELVFNPFSQWLKKGPITDIFIIFLKSDLNSFSKFTMVSYIGTYYAIALWPLLLVNFFVVGWYQQWIVLSHSFAFYNEGYGVFLSVIIVFNVVGPVSNAAIRYRAKNEQFFRGAYENLKWSVLLIFFLGGLSMHLSYALVAHMCDLNMQWGATAKTFEGGDFFTEIPKIWARFKWVYATVVVLVVLQVYMAVFATPLDRIWQLTANGPLIWLLFMHAMMPVVLNPNSYASEWHTQFKTAISKFTSAWTLLWKQWNQID